MNSFFRTLCLVFLVLASLANAEPLRALVNVDDGLQFDEPTNIADDYVRLTLVNPSYTTASAIQKSVTDFLGPGLVEVQSNALVLIQAPRDSGQRVSFIAALLELEIQE